MDCTHAERYALKRLGVSTFVAIAGEDQSLVDVGSTTEAYLFHTHEAALRAANELNRGGRGPIDVVKIEWEPAGSTQRQADQQPQPPVNPLGL
ncbi:MAG: hypothetical protein VKK05_00200 [Synechococcus sp.]|nr:hypothetical protein [Synechococcus sp.]